MRGQSANVALRQRFYAWHAVFRKSYLLTFKNGENSHKVRIFRKIRLDMHDVEWLMQGQSCPPHVAIQPMAHPDSPLQPPKGVGPSSVLSFTSGRERFSFLPMEVANADNPTANKLGLSIHRFRSISQASSLCRALCLSLGVWRRQSTPNPVLLGPAI